jgi:hypothetical protein
LGVPSQFPSLWGLWRSKSGGLLSAPFDPCFACTFANNETPHSDTPYASISVNYRLFDRLFRQEYRDG